ncbi:MAG: cytochrome bc complex cytochrome b subunit, partial [Thiovulaceae bacterium]|nr:cytochrome bc complex cytochrome b subunit [Sulfurimonadaceae bacterium]
GLIAFAFAQVIFFLLPFLDRSPNAVPASRRGPFMLWFWAMLVDMIVLTAMGKLPPEGVFSTIGYVAALVFIGLWIALPIITKLEKKL